VEALTPVRVGLPNDAGQYRHMSGHKTSHGERTALNATRGAAGYADMLALNAEGGAPEYVMLLPAGPTIATMDGRGPYRVTDMAKLAETSLQAAGGKLPIDENHSTDLAAPQGRPSPARGWIVDLQARADGLYGKVDWTDSGKQLLADRAYRGISAVFRHLADGTITRLLRASLTNVPNLRGLTALNAEEVDMDFIQKLRQALGLADDADEATALNAVAALKQSTALQSALAPIAKAAGLNDDAEAGAVLAAVTALATEAKKAPGADQITALQAELKTVTANFAALQAQIAADRATAFVDGAIKAGRVGVKPLRDHYIAMHAADPARVEREINAMPILGASGVLPAPPKGPDGKIALNAEHTNVSKLLGLKPEDLQKTLAAEAAEQETA